MYHPLTCNDFVFFAITALIGMSRIMTPTPARIDGPRVIHRKYRQTHIWNGADHSMLRYVVSSMNRWASTDMRFTISPTVEVRLAALVSFKACNRSQQLQRFSFVTLGSKTIADGRCHTY